MTENKKNVKEQVIDIVKAMEKQIGTDVMGDLFDKENGNNKKIGSNQFRNIAATCRKAESYEELELMIQYSIAKVGGTYSWKTDCANKKTFGANILEAMQQVKAIDNENVLEHLELFFGYMYWQIRVWADTYGNNSSNNRNGNNHNQQNSGRYGGHSHGNQQYRPNRNGR